MRPRGWPAPGRDARPLLEAATAIARERGQCWLGLEHLLEGLRECREGGSMTDAVRLRLARVNRGVLQQFGTGFPVSELPPEPTPWMVALGGVLEPTFDMDALWRAVAESFHPGMEVLFGDELPIVSVDGSSHRPPTGIRAVPLAVRSREAGEEKVALTLVWGPLGGAGFAPKRGNVLGRASENTDIDLYEGCPVRDGSLSRTHLKWRGWGEIEMLRDGMGLHRGGERMLLDPGRHEIGPGDLLQLTQSTWLHVLR